MASAVPTTDALQLEQMHAVYRQGGTERATAPHVIYQQAGCPHAGCPQALRAIDFHLKAFERGVRDLLVRAWWDDVGFAGQCPTCHGWIHFTIRGKKPVDEMEAHGLPRLPENWAAEAVIL
jgi:hypothetical protein